MSAADCFSRTRLRRGITLTEILIAILILAVGLASLATLFPLGLLRLRDAARSTRSAYLTESAACDVTARGSRPPRRSPSPISSTSTMA